MDELILILAVIGILAKVFGKKDKKKKKRDPMTPPPVREELSNPEPDGVPVQSEPTKIPFTKEEWVRFLAEEAKPAPKAAAPEGPAPKPIPKPRPAKRPARPVQAPKAPVQPTVETAAPIEAGSPIDAEGCIGGSLPHDSHEGESIQEHAAHRQRMARAEEQLQQEQETLAELRSMNLKKLRAAVVTSEILAKPVALRGHGRR